MKGSVAVINPFIFDRISIQIGKEKQKVSVFIAATV